MTVQTFEVGETVVYPHHGAAYIEEIKNRTIRGEKKTYLKLRMAQGDLTIEVPAEMLTWSVCAMSSIRKAWKRSLTYCVRNIPKNPPTGPGAIKRTWRNWLQVT